MEHFFFYGQRCLHFNYIKSFLLLRNYLPSETITCTMLNKPKEINFSSAQCTTHNSRHTCRFKPGCLIEKNQASIFTTTVSLCVYVCVCFGFFFLNSACFQSYLLGLHQLLSMRNFDKHHKNSWTAKL